MIRLFVDDSTRCVLFPSVIRTHIKEKEKKKKKSKPLAKELWFFWFNEKRSLN